MEPSSSLQPKDLHRIYKSLRLIRRAEEEVARIYPSDKIKSPVHLSIGQESVAVGVCDVLGPKDAVSGTYRGHATYLAKGGSLKGMIAEMYGKDTGCARGKGGSMHLIEAKANVLGSSAVVGTTIPIAMGWALAAKMRKSGAVIAAFLGDGATEEGAFYESLNFASLHKLPIIFVCENNGYAIHTPLSKRWATEHLCQRRDLRHPDLQHRRRRRLLDPQRGLMGGRHGAQGRRPDLHGVPDLPLARARRPGRGLSHRLSPEE